MITAGEVPSCRVALKSSSHMDSCQDRSCVWTSMTAELRNAEYFEILRLEFGCKDGWKKLVGIEEATNRKTLLRSMGREKCMAPTATGEVAVWADRRTSS